MKKALFIGVLITAGALHAQKPVTGETFTATRAGAFDLRSLPKAIPGKPYERPPQKESPNMMDKRLFFRPKSEQRRLEKQREVAKPAITPVQAIVSQQTTGMQREQIFESPCISYRGMSVASLRPPDVTSAAGADHVMLADNDSICIISKTGQMVWRQKHGQGDGFWSSADTTGLFDPKITYDALSHRWIIVICADPGSVTASTTSSILIAVSASYDPTGGWFLYSIDADANNDQWFDYPSVGFNRNWIVVTGNMFPNAGMTATTECRVFVLNKAQLYAGAAITITAFNTSTEYNTICPALTYDAGENDLWCATNDDTDDNDIRYFRVGGTAAAPTLTEEGFISITGDWGNGNMNIAPQAGSATLLHAGDHDILSAVFRGGRMYTAQTIFTPDGTSPTTCTMQLISCTPGSTTVHEALRFASNTTSMYAYPNLAITANGDWIISCARFTNTIFPSAAVLVRRAGNPVFTETTFKAGEDWYFFTDNNGRNRWGDYSGCMVDPMDDNSVWVSAEYARPRTASSGNWGTWIAKICSGVCVANVSLATVQPSGTLRKFEASNTVFANNTVQPGAYIQLDGGARVVLQPGFRATNGSRVRVFNDGCGGAQ